MFSLRSIIFMATLAIVYTRKHIQTYRVHAKVNSGYINEDIVMDTENDIMTVSIGQVSPMDSDCPSTVNLHDFKKGMLAIKNIDNGACTIMATSETLDGTTELLENITRFHLQHEIKDEKIIHRVPITLNDLIELAGEDIADFCRGYDLFFGHQVGDREL